MRYVGFEIGRGGPRGERVPAARLCERWNARLREAQINLVIHHGHGATGNYLITSQGPSSVSEVSRVLSIAARHGARNVRVFGSVARGEATHASDLDLLVDVGPNPSAFFPGGLVAELESRLGRRIDVLTENALHWYIRERILREALPL